MGYLAAARLNLGQRAEAKVALKEAMRRDPMYLYAPATLFRVQLEDKELDDAEETLRFFEKFYPGPPTLGRTVLLATRRKYKNRDRARDALAALAPIRPAPGTDDGDLPGAVTAMENAGWRDEAEAALHPALLTPDIANPEAGALWLNTRAHQGKWRGLGKIVRRLPEGEFARRTRLTYLSMLKGHRRRLRTLAFIWQMRQTLRADTESWGQAGFALTGGGFHRFSARWLADYAARADVRPWMLSNLAASLRAIGKHWRALEVNRHALTLPPDHTRLKHVAWVALEDALTDGEVARLRAGSLFAEVAARIEQQTQPFRYLDALTREVLASRALPADDRAARRAAFRAGQKALREEGKIIWRTAQGRNRAVLRLERRARWRLAKEAGLWRRFLLQLAAPSSPRGAERLGSIAFWILLIYVAIVIAQLAWAIMTTLHP